ncbi:WecB/TagA/CpsF family glycosyltransferase [Geodermatophilus sp. CPCC 205506]|uniref:WecB/TagA/CpsF family glycosyltransferase n=1 Tax=Geodermatophilus sp. CPCC 205506 TaxID=2936596 RepID=UPI003EEAD9E4
MSKPSTARGHGELEWAARLAQELGECLRTGRGAAVTWYNHWSIGRSIDDGVGVERFTHVGIDGMFLRRLVDPTVPRTSADLVLPLLLESAGAGCRVALIGSTRTNVEAARAAIEAMPSAPAVVLTRDGFEELVSPEAMAQDVLDAGAHVVIVGLGAPLQDHYVLGLRASGLTSQVLVTCGGWIDQSSNVGYYPRFAYTLKINWLIRVLREPRRLWRRYTVEALGAVRRRREMRRFLLEQGSEPLGTMRRACSAGAEVG